MSEKKKRRSQKFKENNEANFEKLKIKERIDTILKEEKPRDVKLLVDLMNKKHEYTKEQILPIIKEMEFNKEIELKEPILEPTKPPKRILDYFWGRNFFAYEFWMTITTISLVLTLVLIDVKTGFFFYLRYVTVCFFMLILSGWTLTSVIFPELDDKLRFLERVATAIGLSIFVLVIDGLFLNYTFHFEVLPITLSLTVIIVVCLILATILRLRLSKKGYIFTKGETEEKIDQDTMEIVEV